MEQTPKEYAKDLVNEFTFECRECDYEWKAKQCAKISINQTLKELVEFDNTDGYAQSRVDYYTEALKEIDKI